MSYKVIFIIVLLMAFSLASQTEMSTSYDVNKLPFHIDTAVMAKQNDFSKSLLHIYTSVEFDEIQFVKVGDGFEGEYELSAIILDDGEQIDGRIWKEEVYVKEYDQTNKRAYYHHSEQSFELDPGKYDISVMIEDLESGRSNKYDSEIKIKNFAKEDLALSDVIFLSSDNPDSITSQNTMPIISDKDKGFRGEILAYFEIYNPKNQTEVDIKYSMYGHSTKENITGEYVKTIDGLRSAEILKIPADSLLVDKYTLEIEANADKGKDKNKKIFFVRWDGMPKIITDINTAIEQLRYIATREEWKKLEKTPDAKKSQALKAFWKAHDPTPGTEQNEAMEAHYARVEYANRHFSVMNREGWQTDRGMVYILLSAPDEVDRNVFPKYSRYPYEIWHYYGINRYFEFYDPTGFGDYRLATPMSIYEVQRLMR
ncbi:GWxTD domain-containing protein [candidate division KSB1 bacterium]|nr:GWxTD domain-containing protein [candidate division KSB1 bacterium]